MGGLMAALADAQAEMQNPPLDGANPHFNSRFSTLKAVLEAVRGPLNGRACSSTRPSRTAA